MFSKVMIKILGILILLGISGCSLLFVGEGMFSVAGNISDQKGETCMIQLVFDGIATDYSTRPISGKFKEDFVVSPNGAVYTVNVLCSGKVVLTKNIQYPREVGVGGTLQLGALSIRE